MGKYLDHLTQLSDFQTLRRKKEYFQYNFSSYITNKNNKILEIGPGLGEFVSFLNDKKIKNITIIDNDKVVLNFVAKKYTIMKKLLTNDLKSVKLENYDLVLMMQVLEHIPVIKHGEIVKRLYKQLNRNGHLVIVVPNANNPLGITERYSDIQHRTSFTTQSLLDLVNISGINKKNIEIKGFEIPPTGVLNILRFLLQKILHIILLIIMIINGGTFFKVMTPNIILVIKK